jgi:hypothetical protein
MILPLLAEDWKLLRNGVIRCEQSTFLGYRRQGIIVVEGNKPGVPGVEYGALGSANSATRLPLHPGRLH